MDTKQNHNIYLGLALLLSTRSESSVFPNPMVGAIITNPQISKLSFADQHSKDLLKNLAKLSKQIESLTKQHPINHLVSAGYHQELGGPHAEVNAINQAKSFFQKHSQDLEGFYKTEEEFFADCTIYISLEPCSHHGKTPPCSDLILKAGIKKLVYAMDDPNPLVSGKGVAKLIDSGLKVISPSSPEEYFLDGINKQAKYLNRVFIKWIKTQKPWVTLKIASTQDGRMITNKDEPRWITNSNSRKLVHKMRACHQLLITGINTIKVDNPSLNVRYSLEELELDRAPNPDVLILKSQTDFTEEERNELEILKKSSRINRKILECRIKNNLQTLKSKNNDLSDFECDNLLSLTETLSLNNYNKIMVEAGPTLSSDFLSTNLVDEIIHFEPLGSRSKDLALEEILERYKEYQLGYKHQVLSSTIDKGSKDESNDICIRIH